MVAQWVKGWPTDLAVPSSSPTQGRKIASHPSYVHFV